MCVTLNYVYAVRAMRKICKVFTVAILIAANAKKAMMVLMV